VQGAYSKSLVTNAHGCISHHSVCTLNIYLYINIHHKKSNTEEEENLLFGSLKLRHQGLYYKLDLDANRENTKKKKKECRSTAPVK